MPTPSYQNVDPKVTQLVLPATKTLLETGVPCIQTIQFAAKASYSNNQTFSVGGIDYEYEVVTSGWSPTGGAVVAIDIHACTDAQSVSVAVAAAVNAQAGSTVTANTPVAGLLTVTAKTPGSAGNVLASGTGAITATITQYGVDVVAALDQSLAQVLYNAPRQYWVRPSGSQTGILLNNVSPDSDWEFLLTMPASLGDNSIIPILRPNSANTGCVSDLGQITSGFGGSSVSYLHGGDMHGNDCVRMELGARIGGASKFQSTLGRGRAGSVGQTIFATGATSVRYSSLLIFFYNAPITGAILRVTEWPNRGDGT